MEIISNICYTGSTMNIKWNEYTWYSKLAAIIFFIAILPTVSFYIGMKYEQTIFSLSILPITTTDTLIGSPSKQSNDDIAPQINLDNNTPNIFTQNYTINLGPDESLSGPELAYTKDGLTIRTAYSVGTTTLERKSLSDTEVFVKEGPYEYYVQSGSQCGACAHVAFNIYYFDFSKGTSTLAYSFPFHTYDLNDTDFVISTDWKRITDYEYLPKNDTYDYYNYKINYQWNATDYCFKYNQTNVFEVCGIRKNVEPPSPRNFTPSRQDF